MMFWVSFIYSIVAPIGVLFVPKFLLVNSIEKGINGRLPITSGFLNVIPWLNSYRMNKLINGKATGLLVLAIYALISFMLLIPARFVFISDVTIQIAMTIWMIVFIAVSYFVEVVLMVQLCSLFDKKKYSLIAVVPFMCAALLLPHIKPYFKQYQDEIDGTFNG